MAEFTPDISLLFNQAFGVSGRIVTFPDASSNVSDTTEEIVFPGIEVVTKEEAIELSYLGTPIVYPVTLKGGSYNIYNDTGEIIEKVLGDFRMPLATLVDFQRSKIGKKTRIAGSNTSVKEQYGHDDWQIRIRGLCLDEPRHPQGAETFMDQHNRILEFEALADSIDIEGDLFMEKGIYRLWMSGASFPQLQGKPRVFPFELTCESDEPLELIL